MFRLKALTAAAVVLAVALAQTSSSSAASPLVSDRSGAPCARTNLHPGLSEQQIASGGLLRNSLLYLPRNFKPATRIPLVLDLHGSGSTPQQQLDRTGIMQTADRNGFAVLAPQGGLLANRGKYRGGYVWNIPGVSLLDGRPVPEDAPDDVAFLEDAITAMNHVLCLDRRRVYVTGFSGGGRMTSQLGCVLSDRIAAIAPVAGLRFPDGCQPLRAEPVISFHGTADEVNPYNGGRGARWKLSVPEVIGQWARVDRCGQLPRVDQVVPLVTRTTFGDCSNGGDVELYTIAGGRHAWPGTPGWTGPRGPQPAFEANELMWAFFRQHPLQG
ncbi:PHB depolymerase family esterase [Kutzneria viridogrisea]|uniref:Polyhydroxybutyrate depolymerase n=2 Tax=Kutzneria TaxID=43356 RepID=W5WFK6_9PSEU|nr:PHB depolymerase family esterase [Kutzneria albida]AHH99983.1 hypothetical protein KALB_6624 [Kutzneria albida DSM 43870]MBA8925163.1 polyhydroxybutyrate depolymerase [Kutzneria viridogrisea]